MARTKREPKQWPGWRFSPDGVGQIFECAEDVPEGWTKKIGEVYVPKETTTLDRDEIMRQLEDKIQSGEVKVHPAWGLAHLKKVLDDASSPR